jgi:hypothetical protein
MSKSERERKEANQKERRERKNPKRHIEFKRKERGKRTGNVQTRVRGVVEKDVRHGMSTSLAFSCHGDISLGTVIGRKKHGKQNLLKIKKIVSYIIQNLTRVN